MNGSIRNRGKRSWEITVEVASRDANGKRRRKFKTVRGSKRDAQRKLREMQHALDTGTYIEPSKTPVAQYLESWLEGYARANVVPRTFDRYEQVIRLHLSPALGNIALQELRPVQIQAYYGEALRSGRNGGDRGLSPTTVLHHHRVLREALKHAMRLQLIDRNPADAVDPPRKAVCEIQVLTPEQTLRLIEAARGDRLFVPLLVGITTGMRRGEVLGLRWQDINLDEERLSLRRMLDVQKTGLAFKQPKTQGSKRSIALSSFVVSSLRSHKARQAEERLLLGRAYRDDDLVFPKPDGSPWHPDTFYSAFKRLLRRAGLPVVRLHDLRHGMATLLLKWNENPKIVSERLGHSNVSMTLDTYSHVLPEMQREAAKKFDDFLKGLK